jgi:ATP:cob(I)alamin adenosyltransferase
MLYTGQGDKGTTKTLKTNERVPKNHVTIEALGAVDELNTWLGFCRVKLGQKTIPTSIWPTIDQVIYATQENLFIIQGELAGAKLTINPEKTKALETTINELENNLQPIKNFIVPGESEPSALFDIARTIARRAERMIIGAQQASPLKGGSLAYMNRLSSLLYALARYMNEQEAKTEKSPTYQ